MSESDIIFIGHGGDISEEAINRLREAYELRHHAPKPISPEDFLGPHPTQDQPRYEQPRRYGHRRWPVPK